MMSNYSRQHKIGLHQVGRSGQGSPGVPARRFNTCEVDMREGARARVHARVPVCVGGRERRRPTERRGGAHVTLELRAHLGMGDRGVCVHVRVATRASVGDPSEVAGSLTPWHTRQFLFSSRFLIEGENHTKTQ